MGMMSTFVGSNYFFADLLFCGWLSKCSWCNLPAEQKGTCWCWLEIPDSPVLFHTEWVAQPWTKHSMHRCCWNCHLQWYLFPFTSYHKLKGILSHSHTWHLLTPLGNKPFENTVGKGEIARNKQFLLFPQCFLPVWITFCHFHQIWNCRL